MHHAYEHTENLSVNLKKGMTFNIVSGTNLIGLILPRESGNLNQTETAASIVFVVTKKTTANACTHSNNTLHYRELQS